MDNFFSKVGSDEKPNYASSQLKVLKPQLHIIAWKELGSINTLPPDMYTDIGLTVQQPLMMQSYYVYRYMSRKV
jgi:hypothetical protein